MAETDELADKRRRAYLAFSACMSPSREATLRYTELNQRFARQYAKDHQMPPTSSLPGLDVSVPNAARMYDFLLGGKDNFAADRKAAGELLKAVPDAAFACRRNRGFLQRMVKYLADEAGIRQFIDIGTGLPTNGSVHSVAQAVAPESRVVYVDNDPVVIRHAEALLAENPNVIVIQGDLRKPGEILADRALNGLINLNEPVAVLLIAILHFIKDDEDPYGAVNVLKDAMVPGSCLAISHGTDDHLTEESSVAAQGIYQNSSVSAAVPRTHEQILRFFEPLPLIFPRLVGVSEWPVKQPEPGEPSRLIFYGGVARK